MKKKLVFYALFWAILVALFHVVVFVTPGEINGVSRFTGSFWISYGFVLVAFAGQLICTIATFSPKNEEQWFLRLPLTTISYSALVLNVAVGAVFLTFPVLPNWLAVLSASLLLGFQAIALLKAGAAASLVGETEEKVQTKTLFIRCLTNDTQALIANAKSDAVRAEVQKLCDTVRYSDPMSHGALATVESQIIIQGNSLSEAVAADDAELVRSMVTEMQILLNDRNKKCQLLK